MNIYLCVVNSNNRVIGSEVEILQDSKTRYKIGNNILDRKQIDKSSLCKVQEKDGLLYCFSLNKSSALTSIRTFLALKDVELSEQIKNNSIIKENLKDL